MGKRDKKVIAVRSMIKAGEIKKISELFEVLPAYHVTEEWGMNSQTMSRRIANARQFRLGELLDLAEFIGVDPFTVIKIAVDSTAPKKKRK